MRILEGVIHGAAEASRLAAGWAIRRPGEPYHFFRAGVALCDPLIRFAGPTYPEETSQPSSHECEGCRIVLLAGKAVAG